MNENKKSLIIVIVLAVIVILLVISGISSSKKSEKIYNDFKEAFNNEEPTLVYIGRPTCTYCQLLTPSINEMKERYDFDYLYINTDNMSQKYMNMIMADLELTKIGTPYLTIVNNTGIVDTQSGYSDYDELFKFLQKNSIIDESATLSLNYIGLEEYKNLLAGSEPSIVVVGQSTCSHCISTKLLLNKIVDEYGTKINYLNVSYLTEEEGAELNTTLDFFSGKWGTPATLIVKDGKMVSVLEGERPEKDFVDFFTEQGVLN